MKGETRLIVRQAAWFSVLIDRNFTLEAEDIGSAPEEQMLGQRQDLQV